MLPLEQESKKVVRSKFQKHLNVLVWKSYVQRMLRWRILALECVCALILCVVSVLIAKPVFLTTLEAEPKPPLSFNTILSTLHNETILGYAPNKEPYIQIMGKAAELLGTEILAASTEFNLNQLLYDRARGNTANRVIWVLWKSETKNFYKFDIRSTEVAQTMVAEAEKNVQHEVERNAHLKAGFLSIQCAVCHALLEHTAKDKKAVNYDLSLVAMPVSPLMQEEKVRRAVSLILMCYTLALLPPVLETEGLVVSETQHRFKRSLRTRDVGYSAIYLGWLAYAYLTALPICTICSITLILIFRWIHLIYALVTLLSYFTVMMMMAFIMSMTHDRPLIAATWTTLQTLLQTFMAELIVHHKNLEDYSNIITFFCKALLPPLGLLNGFNQFALLQTGNRQSDSGSMGYTILSWAFLIVIYFNLLMLLQRTIGSAKAIGGQVSWKSIIFKQAEDKNKLRPIKSPIVLPNARLQEVNELVAKGISFRHVSKTIMEQTVLDQLSFDIYRGEFSLIFTERVQQEMTLCIEDLLTGLTHPDSGTINVLGVELKPSRNLLTEHMMTGYCDQSSILCEDLTVEEHLYLYTQISLWHESSEDVFEFSVLRHKILKLECDLHDVYHVRVGLLGKYYLGQLCWAIAILLEPRLIIVPNFIEDPVFWAVIKDKIMTNKSFMTIIRLTSSSLDLQYADRLFLLDNKVLAFGGTPSYMFFKYGRDYRIRVNFETGSGEDAHVNKVIRTANKYGASVRARLGSLLILRMATSPSDKVASLTNFLEENRQEYSIYSIYVSLPDPEEVFRRAIRESRERLLHEPEQKLQNINAAIQEISNNPRWTARKTYCNIFLHLRMIAWKYFTCYINYRIFFIITILSAVVAGASLGYSLGTTMKALESGKTSGVKVLTVESMNLPTELVMRLDKSKEAISVSTSYIWSHTDATDSQVEKMSYFTLDRSESLREFLATCAVDSPQHYVHLYAYGMDIYAKKNKIIVKALYSPLHVDRAASARSLARVYMALMRHYSGQLDASIEITDNPLIMDITPLMEDASEPPLVTQFLLVLSIAHITLVPSKEYGLIRHTQVHANNFSPFWYWLNLAFCDLILYWILAVLTTVVAFTVIFVVIRLHFNYTDLVAIPFMLMVYGVGCIPQAYLFSLGPRAYLNSMALIITNIVFGEATLVAKLFYGNIYNYALSFMALSPQFNMAYALVKIKRIFVYNSECLIYDNRHLCTSKTFHKCCSKCGVLEKCYERKPYLAHIYVEVGATLGTSLLMFTILLFWEYRYIQAIYHFIMRCCIRRHVSTWLKIIYMNEYSQY